MKMPTVFPCQRGEAVLLNSCACKVRDVLSFSWLSLKSWEDLASPFPPLMRCLLFSLGLCSLSDLEGKLSWSKRANLLPFPEGHCPTQHFCLPCFWEFPAGALAWAFCCLRHQGGLWTSPPLPVQRWTGGTMNAWLPGNFQGLLLPLELIACPLSLELYSLFA